MKKSLAFSRQSILLLLVLLTFSSCVEGIFATKFHSYFEDNSEIYYVEPVWPPELNPKHSWPLASSEVLEFADEKGELSYYIPIKVILMEENPEIAFYLRMYTFSDGIDHVWNAGGVELMETRKNVVLYVPLLDPFIDVLPKDIAQLLSEQKISAKKEPKAFLENELPDDYRLVRRMKVPDLRTRIDKIDFISYTLSLPSPEKEHCWGNDIAFWSVGTLVDLPLTVVGSCAATVYENTIGLPILIYRKLSSQSTQEAELDMQHLTVPWEETE